jgi:hypothetical protein
VLPGHPLKKRDFWYTTKRKSIFKKIDLYPFSFRNRKEWGKKARLFCFSPLWSDFDLVEAGSPCSAATRTPLTVTPQDIQELDNFYAVNPLPENLDQADPRFKHLIWGPLTVQFLRRTGRNCLSVAIARVREVPHLRNCLYDYVIYERGYVFLSQNQAFSGMEMDAVAIHNEM